MPGIIAAVFAGGHRIDRDDYLDDLKTLDVETDTGNRYVVVRADSSDDVSSDWDVQLAAGPTVVGHIHQTVALVGAPRTYHYVRYGASPRRGNQFDLWDAIQSLTD